VWMFRHKLFWCGVFKIQMYDNDYVFLDFKNLQKSKWSPASNHCWPWMTFTLSSPSLEQHWLCANHLLIELRGAKSCIKDMY